MNLIVLISEVLEHLRAYATIGSFTLTAITVVLGFLINNKVKLMQNRAIFNMGIDEKLDELAVSQSMYIVGSNSLNDIRHEIHLTEVILSTIKGMIGEAPKNVIETVDSVITETKRIKSGRINLGSGIEAALWWKFWIRRPISEDDISTYYSMLVACHYQLKEYAKNRKKDLV